MGKRGRAPGAISFLLHVSAVAGQGGGGVLFMTAQGLWTATVGGDYVTQIATYSCANCAGLAVGEPYPAETPDRWVFWTDDDKTTTTVYRTPLEPPGGAPLTPEVVCTRASTSISGAGGLAVDSGTDSAGGRREVYVYFSTTIFGTGNSLGWQVWRCGTSKTSMPGTATEWQVRPVRQDWGGSLAYSAKFNTLYLTGSLRNKPEVELTSFDATVAGGASTLAGASFAENYSPNTHSLGGVVVCGDELYAQASTASTLADVYVFAADPAAAPVTPTKSIYAITPGSLAYIDRPRTTSNRPAPPALGCAADAPGWVLWADHTQGKIFFGDIVNDPQGVKKEVYALPSGPPQAGQPGIGPIAWFKRITLAPSASPSSVPSAAPSAPPLSGPTVAPSASPTGAPTVPPTASPAKPTTSPAAGQVNVTAPTTSPAAAAGTPTGAPQAAPPTSPPTATGPVNGTEAPASDDGTDMLIWIIVGVVAVLCLLIGLGVGMWLKRGKEKPVEKEVEPLNPPEPAPLRFAPGDRASVVDDEHALQAWCRDAGLSCDVAAVGSACQVTAANPDRRTYTIQLPDGATVDVPESALTDPRPEPKKEEPAGPRWKVGDRCAADPDEAALRRHCDSAGCHFAPEMLAAVGQNGVVTQVHPDGNLVRVEFGDGNQWVMPADALRDPVRHSWQPGDAATVMDNAADFEARCEQAESGWIPEMAPLAAANVTVLEVKDGGKYVRIGYEKEQFVVPAETLRPRKTPPEPKPPPTVRAPDPPPSTRPVYHTGVQLSHGTDGSSRWVTIPSVPADHTPKSRRPLGSGFTPGSTLSPLSSRHPPSTASPPSRRHGLGSRAASN
eukprot:TRINITY_DN7709_c0_g1_i1.p1 TRINITY_DN7709_c0_g1~~TRINITY_DN7709_c0_g1_i1.p1  ORF type:complete len:840 (+),score=173.54 TRINITY_DN7709_c0_g1_i1:68-2587(+)